MRSRARESRRMEKTLSVFQCDRREKESGERLREWRLREELQTRNKRKKKRDREFLLSSLPPFTSRMIGAVRGTGNRRHEHQPS